ncbi:MAG TPA: hypothetical protein VFN97_25145 [Actinospica sp.]|nr:hypothetical protein [Actinospica sp.]
MSRPGESTPTARGSRGGQRSTRVMSDLLFGACKANVPVAILRDSPILMVAAVEDLCWRLALLDCSEHEPPRYERARHRAWKQESARIEDKRRRVRAMVDEALMAS